MQPTGRPGSDQHWQPLSEVDPADAQEQARDVLDVEIDPEAPVTGPQASDLVDLGAASEADLAEQLRDVPLDDDGER
ncbi:MAG TPA: hypothetical protein VHN80_17110 [Kineosporiaceae bacterium]|jgi:hypothetical protein|nr:hypothetical protein [Kineosporiaceae bacterium]